MNQAKRARQRTKAAKVPQHTKAVVWGPQHGFIARTLKNMRPDPAQAFDYELWKDICFELARDFADDNVLFNMREFLTNCGIPPRKKEEKNAD